MGISDDWSYILSAHKLAATGHITYVGWSAAMLIWQLYLGAAFIKLFGFSFTVVRMSTLLSAVAIAFFLQRCMVRANISERNATLGTLALVLSPLYLVLSVTFLSDIHGLLAIVLCLYGCLRALQSATSRATIGWLCFAVATNAIIGTSRQLAWLGVLVMVPSTLWLLRARRRVFIAGSAITFAGALFILAGLLWLRQQPYTLPEHLLVAGFSMTRALSQLLHCFWDLPFLLLPITVLFLPEMRRFRPRNLAIVAIASLGYMFLTVYLGGLHPGELMEPNIYNRSNTSSGFGFLSHGQFPVVLHRGERILLTLLSFGGLLGLIATLARKRVPLTAVEFSKGVSWKQLGMLFVPFTIAYTLLLTPRAGTFGLMDRYSLGLLLILSVCLVRYYQERVQPRLPLASLLMLSIMAIYGIVETHNMFALYRARVAMTAELNAAGVPDTSVDSGLEYNMQVELQHSRFINDPAIEKPAHTYVPAPPLPAGTCEMVWYDKTPHIIPRYGISFDPNACYGPAPFAPVSYSQWFVAKPGMIYVVNYTADSKR